MDYREIASHYENIVGESYRIDKGGLTLNKSHCRPSEILRTMRLKDQGFKEAKNTLNLRQTVKTGVHQLGDPDEEEEDPRTLDLGPYRLPDKDESLKLPEDDIYTYKDSQYIAQINHDRFYPNETLKDNTDTFARDDDTIGPGPLKKDLYDYYSKDNTKQTLDPIIHANLMNYRYEAIDISMAHSLAYSCTYKQKDNVVWHQENKWIGYTFESIVIIEQLNVEHQQKFLKEGNDTISNLKLSPNNKLLMAYTYNASIDGLPMIYVWDSTTFKKVAEISINQRIIVSADFSPNSNMILVVSFDDTDEEDPNSVVAIWDFMDGN